MARNVGESSGNPAGRKGYSQFYDVIVDRYKLEPKARLLAQSRGGLMLYNWAAEHPQNLAAIAGTYTVVNLEEWTTTAHPRIEGRLDRCLTSSRSSAGA